MSLFRNRFLYRAGAAESDLEGRKVIWKDPPGENGETDWGVRRVRRANLCLALALALMLLAGGVALAMDADDWEWHDLVGYAVVGISRYSGEFTGSQSGKVIVLDNGWVFEFTRFRYHYAYNPQVVVFVKVDPATFGPKYRLLIDSELFDAR